MIRCGGSPWLFAGGGIGTSSGGHQLPLSAGGRSPASFHGILQGSTGSGICSAFADLVGFFMLAVAICFLVVFPNIYLNTLEGLKSADRGL